MEKPRKLSLKEEINKEAKQIEKKLSEHPELDEIKVTEEMERALLAKIRAYEQEKEEEDTAHWEYTEKHREENRDMEISEELFPDISVLKTTDESSSVPGLTRKIYRKKHKKKVMFALAAVFVLVVAMSVTSVGSKSYLKVLIEKITGKSPVQVTNVKDMDSRETVDNSEVEAYLECETVLKRKIVKMVYRPKEMVFEKCMIDEETQQGQLFFRYGDGLVWYRIYLNNTDSSWGATEEDKRIRKYSIDVSDVPVQIEEYQLDDKPERRYEVSFEYQGVYYQLKGEMEEEELTKIIKNLNFF